MLMKRLVLQEDGGKKNGTEPHGQTDRTSTTKDTGSSPNPNDAVYYSRRDITDATSPTGLHYRFTGYLVFDYFITDGQGNATITFETGSCYHVLWKTTQRTRTTDDGILKTTTFTANTSSPAYDINYPNKQ